MNEDVGPGQQLPASIVDIAFDEQRPGGEVDRVGVPHQPTVERPPGKLIEGEHRGAARAGRARVDLGHGYEHAERTDGRHMEELIVDLTAASLQALLPGLWADDEAFIDHEAKRRARPRLCTRQRPQPPARARDLGLEASADA